MVPRPYSELLIKLRSQVGFLERSSVHFDMGHEDEGERLALATRVLLHDTTRSHSLLDQLGVKSSLRYTDTSLQSAPETKHLGGGQYSTTATVHAGLVLLRTTDSGVWGYAPVLTPESEGRINSPVPFEHWWESPILIDTNGKSVTRKSVTLAVANKDGGAHIAKAIPEALRQLGSGSSMPFQTVTNGQEGDIPGVVMATMRQIAFELLDSFHRDLPNFITDEPIDEGIELSPAEKSGVARNEKCICDSGKKFKRCHGS
jgi:hypothetical protein